MSLKNYIAGFILASLLVTGFTACSDSDGKKGKVKLTVKKVA